MGDRGGGGQLVDTVVSGDVMEFQDIAVCTGDEGVSCADNDNAKRYGVDVGYSMVKTVGWKRRCRVYLQEIVTMAQ